MAFHQDSNKYSIQGWCNNITGPDRVNVAVLIKYPVVSPNIPDIFYKSIKFSINFAQLRDIQETRLTKPTRPWGRHKSQNGLQTGRALWCATLEGIVATPGGATGSMNCPPSTCNARNRLHHCIQSPIPVSKVAKYNTGSAMPPKSSFTQIRSYLTRQNKIRLPAMVIFNQIISISIALILPEILGRR